MDNNFVKADSGNLPKVDAIMIGVFFTNNPDFYAAELRNVKTAMERTYYGTRGMRRVTVDCSNGEKVVFQFSYAPGNNNGTSVEDGQMSSAQLSIVTV